MRINKPKQKGRLLARGIQAILLVGCAALYVWGDSSIIVVDSSGSPGSYRTGLTEGKK